MNSRSKIFAAGIAVAVACILAGHCNGSDQVYRIQVEITSPLPEGRVPVSAKVNLQRVIQAEQGSGVADPNSIELFNAQDGTAVPFLRNDDFSYGPVGHIEWVVQDPDQRRFEIRFRNAPARTILSPQLSVPAVGLGDLLRYGGQATRPVELNAPARLVDLTGDGLPDLVGAWNYAFRPGEPWNGLVCFPRLSISRPEKDGLLFGDMLRIRYVSSAAETAFRHFDRTYMEADVADFDGDALPDLIYCPSGSDQLFFYRNTGSRDAGGMPVFTAIGQTARQTTQWQHFSMVDLDGDGILDVTIGDLWLKGTGIRDGIPGFAAAVDLDAGDVRCFFDVDGDGWLDAVTLAEQPGAGLSNFSVAWRRNLAQSRPAFGEAQSLESINAHADYPVDVTAVREGQQQGLLVTQQHWETLQLFEQLSNGPDFRAAGLVRSPSAVAAFGDQAWPCCCDWDGDGVLDLLIGGGYGWPRIVINDGTRQKPAYRAPQKIESDGVPIRLTRNEILGTDNWHDMGYSYPEYIDWDDDGLPDLMLANETNRIFWYRNTGTRQTPQFGARQQVICDGFPDSAERRARSAELADDAATPRAPYPAEPDQPFYWRTGPAFADWNADGLTDFVTADGQTREATLFVQYRDDQGALRLRKEQVLQLTDGRAIHHTLVEGSRGWTESFRAADWNGDGLTDLIYSHAGQPKGGSIQLLLNEGTPTAPRFRPPEPVRLYGQPLNITAHGPHPWVGDYDGDGLVDVLACVEWSVYPFFAHHALQMPSHPTLRMTPAVASEK